MDSKSSLRVAQYATSTHRTAHKPSGRIQGETSIYYEPYRHLQICARHNEAIETMRGSSGEYIVVTVKIGALRHAQNVVGCVSTSSGLPTLIC